MLKNFKVFSVFATCIMVISCTSRSRYNQNIIVDKSVQTSINKTTTDTVKIIDSISLVIAERENTIYTRSVFAGLKMGSSKAIYDQAIRNYTKEFGNQIYIADSINISKLKIGSITPSFFQNRLYQIDIMIPKEDAIHQLSDIFTKKYGKTKDNYWEYKNIIVFLTTISNTLYDPAAEKGYRSTNTNNRLYYASNRRGTGAPITKESAFTHIVYIDKHICKLAKQEKKKQDSIKKEAIKREQQIEYNKTKKQIENI